MPLMDLRNFSSQLKKRSSAYATLTLFAVLLVASLTNCKSKKINSTISLVSPDFSTTFSLGDKIPIEINQPKELTNYDSTIVFLDGKRLGSYSKNFKLSTDSLPLGNRSLTITFYKKGISENELQSNFIIKSNKAPTEYKYKVIKSYAHDTSCYTEGLEYYKGFLYESGGLKGKSNLRKTEITSGKIVQETKVDTVFAEGIVIIGNKVLQLTYTENMAIEYDLKSLKPINKFTTNYSRQGWGLCSDGNKIFNSDGTNIIYLLNKQTYKQEGLLEVYDANGPVTNLNELEYINGKIFANIYQSDKIVEIDPKSGAVIGFIDLSDLYPMNTRMKDNPYSDVLNGIAWDNANNRLFVTGKNWKKLFQIELIK